MIRSLTAGVLALVATFMLFGTTSGADAGWRHHCAACSGPIPPSYSYSLTHRVSHVTRYHDVSRTHYVHRIHPFIHVTHVQPVVYEHDVLRVHHHTVAIVRPVHLSRTVVLPTHHVTTHSVVNTYDCSCAYHHHGW